MPRPCKERNVYSPPNIQRFKPAGIPASQLETVAMTLDEYEAIRLADYEGLEHLEASQKMNVSRPTFTRLIDRARKKMGKVLIEGSELIIEGGNISFEHTLLKCRNCGESFKPCEMKQENTCPSCGTENIKNLNEHYGKKGRCRNKKCCGK